MSEQKELGGTPEIVDQIDQDEAEFLEAWGAEPIHARTEVDSRIDWLMERIAKRRALVAENNAIASKRADQIEDWRVGENAKLERSIDWFRYQIRELLPIDGEAFKNQYGKKSRVLPFGTVGFKSHPSTLEVFNEEDALAWAKARGLEIKVKESVTKTTLKKALGDERSGDGFELIEHPDDFFVRIGD